MGGVPVLVMMMAAAGITYGWQPDNKGGVEYIIQIPPDQLHELERMGEISSAIDPAVQGHVSRVVIKVGNSSLPQTMPSNLRRPSETAARSSAAGSLSGVATTDHSPMPIPEMDDTKQAIPIAGLDSIAGTSAMDDLEINPATGRSTQDPAAVMKPDANDPGFNLPPSLSNAGQGDAATSSNGYRVPPPATRSPLTRPQAPAFTGSDLQGEMARTRAGGPSTNPTDSRDNSWRDFTGAASTPPALAGPPNPFANRGTPSTTPTNPQSTSSPFANSQPTNPNLANPNLANPNLANPNLANPNLANPNLANPNLANPNLANPNLTNPNLANPNLTNPNFANSQRNNPQAANGLAPHDTFGRMPGGLQAPNAGNDRPPTYADRNANPASNNYSQGGLSAAEQDLRDRQAQYAQANATGRSPYDPNAMDPRSVASPYSQAGVNPYDTKLNSRDPLTPQTRITPDARLTQAELALGAWSVDAYGRPLDRDGRLIDTNNPSRVAYDPTGRQPASPMPDQTFSRLGQPNPTPSSLSNGSPSDLQTRMRQVPPGYPQSPLANSVDRSADDYRNAPTGERDRQGIVRDQSDPPSLVDRRGSSAIGAGSTPRQQVAAQPLFNGLLLISFVANVYLIFWLKNLRVRFHELVAAKRVANASSSST